MTTYGKTHFVLVRWAPAILFSAITLAHPPVASAAGQATRAESKTGKAESNTSQPDANQAQIKSLLDRARAQAAGGHADLASKSWQAVLAADSNNVEALDGLAHAATAKGNLPLASIYTDRLDRLRAIHPPVSSEALGTVTTSAVESESNRELLKAGTLARQGRYTEAMVVYKQLFGNAPPPGDAALAYYETESTIRNSRPHAIVSLRRLAERYPSDERYPLALSRVLAYTAGGRPESTRPLPAPLAPHAVESVKPVAPTQAQDRPTTQKGAAQVVVAVPPVRPAQSLLPVQDAASHLPAAVNAPAQANLRRPLARETVSAKAFKAKATIAKEAQEFGAYVPYQPPAPAAAQPGTAAPASAPAAAKPSVTPPLPAAVSPQGNASVPVPLKKDAAAAGSASGSPKGATNGESKPPVDAYNTSDSESLN